MFSFSRSFLFLTVPLVLVGAGCSPTEIANQLRSRVVDEATQGRVNLDPSTQNVTVHATTDTAFTVGEQVERPLGFPQDIPQYPTSSAIAVFMGQILGDRATLTLRSPDAVPMVRDWYVQKLAQEGWKTTSTVSSTVADIRAYEKGDIRLAVTVSSSSKSETTVLLVRTLFKK
jgi:hypothetical protein